jgi:ADP-heptose:LPS heptosyltransferase
MKVTPCECTGPGYCPRHRCDKVPHWFKLCQSDPDFFALWEKGDGPGQMREFRCVYRGAQTGEKECPSCGGHVLLKVFGCSKHERCTIAKAVEGLQCCAACPDRDSGAKRIILHNGQSVGDVACLSGAVKALKDRLDWRIEIDVRTSCGEVWEAAPYVTPLADDRGQHVETDCDKGPYATINRCNQRPIHQVEAYCESLSREAGESFTIDDWTQPSIRLTNEEKNWASQVQEITGKPPRYWIVNAGIKADYTTKRWHGYQEVIDRTAEHVTWVQIGEAQHRHTLLRGVLDLRGQTDLRQLVRLVYHAAGVLCGVTGLMHLAHWVERPASIPFRRHAVIIAGGREPLSWFAYPGHQIFHTIGELDCCAAGGCWRSRVKPENDGESHDQSLCEHPRGDQGLCMEMIDPAAVAATILRLCR